ncbi:MAG: hypothetical protein ACHQ5A_14925 [Opitutales bacterium]
MAITFRYLTVWLALAAAAFAPVLRADESPQVKLHFTVFCPDQIAPGTLSYVTGPARRPRLQPLLFYPTSRSPVCEFSGALPLRIVDSESQGIVASVDVPAGVTEPLLILLPIHPVPTRGPRYQVILLDDSRTKHGAGGLAILNFSGMELAGTVDRAKVQLAHGYNGPFAIGTVAQVHLQASFRGRDYHSFGGTIEPGHGGRALLILLPPYYQGSLEVQSRLLLDEGPILERKGGAAKS